MREDKHPIFVANFNGSLATLAHAIHGMRYDKVVDFYREVRAELEVQYAREVAANRPQLAALIFEAQALAKQQEQKFRQIYEICKPHMKDELAN